MTLTGDQSRVKLTLGVGFSEKQHTISADIFNHFQYKNQTKINEISDGIWKNEKQRAAEPVMILKFKPADY